MRPIISGGHPGDFLLNLDIYDFPCCQVIVAILCYTMCSIQIRPHFTTATYPENTIAKVHYIQGESLFPFLLCTARSHDMLSIQIGSSC